MKKALLFFLLLALALSYHSRPLKIKLRPHFAAGGGASYKLSCDNADGNVFYSASGLPASVQLLGDTFDFPLDVRSGTYVITVKATDASGRTSQQVFPVTVGSVSSSSTSTVVSQASSQVSSAASVTEAASRLGSIINQHSTVTSRTDVSYQNNRFPEVTFPTGANVDAFNAVPTNVLSRQAVRSDANRNVITADDVVVRTASERHQSAIKGITNLLKIIDQGRANINQAQLNIETYTVDYNAALAARKEAQTIIISAENKVTQIESAITGLEGNIAQLAVDLQAAIDVGDALEASKRSLLETIAGEETTKAGLLKELEDVNADLAVAVKDLAVTLEKCQFLDGQIAKTADSLAKAKAAFDEIVKNRKVAEVDVANKKNKVKDLRRQLADAEEELATAQIKLADIQAEEDRLPEVLGAIEADLAALEYKSGECRSEQKGLEAEIDKLKNDDAVDLTNQIAAVEASILDHRKQVSDLDDRLSDNAALIADLKAKLEKAQADLEFLNAQIVDANESLRVAYTGGNDANTVVAHAKENLDAAVARFKSENQIVCEATLNLEKARAEENLARLALEELIAKYSDALPYSIVPNGNGLTNLGEPFGNNPSGSALGSVNDGYTVSDFTHYLSNAFGAGIHPSFNRPINHLYPFGLGGAVVRQGLRRGCGTGYGPLKAIVGRIVTAGDNSFDVKVDAGETYQVKVGSCTKLSSNAKNYRLAVGDEAIVKGSLHGLRVIDGAEAICLH